MYDGYFHFEDTRLKKLVAFGTNGDFSHTHTHTHIHTYKRIKKKGYFSGSIYNVKDFFSFFTVKKMNYSSLRISHIFYFK